ncbi:transporter [Haloferax sp. MBLA0076]|uniref:Transporter n=1 Tax=Haloferax litoreum TaxID=2666140 RepID=A0A6A8GFT7_9EURY|nr:MULTISPECIES: transporter [Haloferax]KAB1193503.1 transporter [Haloferax sp. CBA1148]MRX22018.1 transporter [Haloferax litoreum]
MSVAPESVSESSQSTLRTAGIGGLFGFGTAVLAYLATYLVTAAPIENSTASQVLEALGSDLATWKVVGWVFLNAHGTTTTFPGLFGTTSSANLIESVEAFSPALYVVPVVALLAAGAVVAIVSGQSSVKSGALAGATTVLGYLPVALAGIVLFTVSIGDAVARPDPVTAALLAGAVYPLALGSFGGGLATALR